MLTLPPMQLRIRYRLFSVVLDRKAFKQFTDDMVKVMETKVLNGRYLRDEGVYAERKLTTTERSKPADN